MRFSTTGVYRVGTLDHCIGHLPTGFLKTSVETALAPGMTGDAADLLDDVAQCIAITIQQNVMQCLNMTGLFALSPQLAAGP